MVNENNQKAKPETLTELFTLAIENLKKRGVESRLPVASDLMASTNLTRKLLDSIFIKPTFLNPVEPDTETILFGIKMTIPAFCSALSKPGYQSDDEMVDLIRGIGKAGSIMMLGIGGSEILQSAIDTGTPTIKIVKPYRDTELIFKKISEAESRGCIAVGVDIDHFYGIFRDGRSMMADTFAPKKKEEMKQLISSTNLPFIIKGVLSTADAENAIELGASALIVSNHASASFDFGIPSIFALPTIVEIVADRATVLVDSGFRTGNDVFKGLALGARAIGFGTSVLAASNAGGADFVEQFFHFINSELKRTMAICGCSNLSKIEKDILIESPELNKWW